MGISTISLFENNKGIEELNVYCFLYDLPFAADMVVDRIQKNYGIDRFQRPLLPFFRHRQDLIRDSAHRSV